MDQGRACNSDIIPSPGPAVYRRQAGQMQIRPEWPSQTSPDTPSLYYHAICIIMEEGQPYRGSSQLKRTMGSLPLINSAADQIISDGGEKA